MEFFALMIFLTVVCGGGGTLVYRSAKDEWDQTFRRAAMITRANLGSKRDKQALEIASSIPSDTSDKKAMEAWTNAYTGKTKDLVLVDANIHTIVRSWNELNDDRHEGIQERWFWECSCGTKEWRKLPESSKNAARRHIKLYGGRNEDGVKDQGWLRGVR